jgi:hypothetical protein
LHTSAQRSADRNSDGVSHSFTDTTTIGKTDFFTHLFTDRHALQITVGNAHIRTDNVSNGQLQWNS